MSQSQGIEVRRVSRRTIAAGAAWAVPVIAVGAAAPAMAASGNEGCTPTFTATANSAKCCNGNVKNMKVEIVVTDDQNCINPGATICITDVTLGNGQDNGTLTFEPGGSHTSICVAEGGTFTVFLNDTDSCTVNLLVSYSLNGGPVLIAPIKSDNIPTGNAPDVSYCTPPAH